MKDVNDNNLEEMDTSPTSRRDASQLVYAIGKLGVDFETNAVLDSFKFYMRGIKDDDGKLIQDPNPYDPKQLVTYLAGKEYKDGSKTPNHMYDSSRIIWTITQDETPIYAIRPSGNLGESVYQQLVNFLQPFDDDKSEENVDHTDNTTPSAVRIDLCSFPGHITDSVKLRSGQIVPVITPSLRAMYNWRTKDLATSLAAENDEQTISLEERRRRANNLVNQLTYQLQNLGLSSADRAINHIVTNMHNVLNSVFVTKINNGYELATIRAVKSDICRPDSDCQDVFLTFFNPTKRLELAKQVYRFTVDVSKVIPVSIGEVRKWYEY